MTFRHPGYRDEHNIIMVLPALDDAQGGIHHETALTACAIVAGNRWDGFLREQGTGSRVTTPRDGILKGKDYFFCSVPSTVAVKRQEMSRARRASVRLP